jgi:hypothetical protein
VIVERYQIGGDYSLDTHHLHMYQRAVEFAKMGAIAGSYCALDTFARNCPWACVTNDADPLTKADHHMDAVDLLEYLLYEGARFGLVLHDPPFSERQAKRYPEQITNFYTTPGYQARYWSLVDQILLPGGAVVKLGYNSNAPRPGWTLQRLLVCAAGGTRNDLLISTWIKPHGLPGAIHVDIPRCQCGLHAYL